MHHKIKAVKSLVVVMNEFDVLILDDVNGINLSKRHIIIKNPIKAYKIEISSILYKKLVKFEKEKSNSLITKNLANSFIINPAPKIKQNKLHKKFFSIRLCDFFKENELDNKYSIKNIQNKDNKKIKISSDKSARFVEPNNKKLVA